MAKLFLFVIVHLFLSASAQRHSRGILDSIFGGASEPEVTTATKPTPLVTPSVFSSTPSPHPLINGTVHRVPQVATNSSKPSHSPAVIRISRTLPANLTDFISILNSTILNNGSRSNEPIDFPLLTLDGQDSFMRSINKTRIVRNVTLNEEADLDEEGHGNDGKDDENTEDADVGQDGHDTQPSEHMVLTHEHNQRPQLPVVKSDYLYPLSNTKMVKRALVEVNNGSAAVPISNANVAPAVIVNVLVGRFENTTTDKPKPAQHIQYPRPPLGKVYPQQQVHPQPPYVVRVPAQL